jgi:hypothetical protein
LIFDQCVHPHKNTKIEDYLTSFGEPVLAL